MRTHVHFQVIWQLKLHVYDPTDSYILKFTEVNLENRLTPILTMHIVRFEATKKPGALNEPE